MSPASLKRSFAGPEGPAIIAAARLRRLAGSATATAGGRWFTQRTRHRKRLYPVDASATVGTPSPRECYRASISRVAQLLVRQLDDDVKAALQRRARSHGRSMEEEVREILREAVRDERSGSVRLGTEISSRFHGIGLEREVEELRGQPVRVVELGEG